MFPARALRHETSKTILLFRPLQFKIQQLCYYCTACFMFVHEEVQKGNKQGENFNACKLTAVSAPSKILRSFNTCIKTIDTPTMGLHALTRFVKSIFITFRLESPKHWSFSVVLLQFLAARWLYSHNTIALLAFPYDMEVLSTMSCFKIFTEIYMNISWMHDQNRFHP